MAQLLAVAAVLLVFAAARWLSARLGNPVWASPVVVAALGVATGLAVTGVPAARFLAAAAPLRWLLGPAVVALAVVVQGNLRLVRQGRVVAAIGGGALVGVASAVGIARLLGLDEALVMALASKTVSTPFAVVIAKAGGGPVALAAAAAVVTGVVGALVVPAAFDALRIKGAVTRGLAMGVSSHIVGTDWLRRRDAAAGAVSATAMVVAGVMTALVLPLLWGWIF